MPSSELNNRLIKQQSDECIKQSVDFTVFLFSSRSMRNWGRISSVVVLRDNFAWWVGVTGGFVLFLYGIIPTFQKSQFHRIYAAYGGVFIVMSILWGWWVDGTVPDRYDVVGTIIAVIGVLIIYYYPRKGENVWSK